MRKKQKMNDSLVISYKDADGVPITSKVYSVSSVTSYSYYELTDNTMFLVWNDYRECFEWVYMSKCKLIKMPK